MRKIIPYICLIFLFSCWSKTPINPEVKKEIEELKTDKYSISKISNGKFFYVYIKFNHKPSNTEAISGGLGVCGQVLEVLKRYSMEKDISVAVTSPTRVKDKVFFYGSAEYSKVTGEFNWKPYKDY